LQFTTQKITIIIKTVIMMTIKYGLQFFFFFELTDNDGQNFLAGIVLPCEQQLLIELAINSGDFW
jgi:hypothetical protein